MPRARRATVARTALACAVVAASLGAVAGVAGGAARAALEWRTCGDGIECTRVRVPVDHHAPDGAPAPQFDVAVARAPARDPERRVGVLVVNPGGPGVSGLDRLSGIADSLPAAVRDRFDVVSFDPRGTGGSAHVDCRASLDDVFDVTFSPDDAAARAELVRAAREVADRCGRHNGERLAQVSTVDTARDLDVVRRALGERQLSFLGYSYGSYLGSLYAALFPDRVRALVLDGAVEPIADPLATVLLQARGFEAGLDAFLADCAADDACAFHRDGASAAAYDRLRARLAEQPLDVRSATEHPLNDTRLDAAVLQLLYGGRASWATLARALDQADRGDGRALLEIADRFVGRRPDGRDDDTLDAFWAISCLDGPPVDVEQMTAIESAVRAEAPRLGGFVVNFSLPCAAWPARAPEPPPSIEGAAPGALVVSTTRDPATPLVSAKRLARALGDAALVVVPGDRHTAFAGGNECVDDTVTAYLLTPRRARAAVTRC